MKQVSLNVHLMNELKPLLLLIEFDDCSIAGDPHYRTFDKYNHHYQGAHTYVLTQSTNLPSSLTPFIVRSKNQRQGGIGRASLLREVYVDVYGITVRMQQKKQVLVRDSWDMKSILIVVSKTFHIWTTQYSKMPIS